MASVENNQPHVALLAFPFGTHAAPLFVLARSLAAAAPGAAFTFLSSAGSIASLPTAEPIKNLRLRHVADGLPPEGGSGPPGDIVERIGMFLKETPGNFRAGMEAAEKEIGGVKVSCVVSDAFLWMAGEVAEVMGVPWVPLWTGGPAGLSAHLYTEELRLTIGLDEQAIPARADEPLHFIPGLSALRVRDLPEGIVFGDIHSGFSLLLHRMANQLPRAAAVALNTFEGLDPVIEAAFNSKFKKPLLVGPFNFLSPPPAIEHEGNECLSWLDRQGPATVAYISFGTVISPPPGTLAELAHALEASGTPFLWSLKEKAREGLPIGFLDRTEGRGLIVAWVPQVRVLGHHAVGAFVTHCGWNSVLESMSGGVPMVCRPFFGDQKANARIVSYVWKIGVSLDGETVTREEMERALNLVMRDEEGKKMRARACELKERAKRAVGPSGSSTENLKSLLEIVCRRC